MFNQNKKIQIITTKVLKINSETIKSLDEYDDNESNSTAEEKNYDRCRIKDESSIGDMDSDRDKAPIECDIDLLEIYDVPESLLLVARRTLSM